MPKDETAQQPLELRISSVVGYLPGLFFVPLLVDRDDAALRFHSAQSLTLFAALCGAGLTTWVIDLLFGRVMAGMVIAGFFFRALAWLVHYPIGIAVSLAYIAGVTAGMVYAAAGSIRVLPIVGRYVQAVDSWIGRLPLREPGKV